MKRTASLLSLIFACIIIVACSDEKSNFKGQQTSKSHNVKILSISPPTSETLYVGKDYDIEVKVEYSFKASEGQVALVIQRGESGHSPVAYSTQPILNKKGTLTLKSNITVPKTNAIQVFTPLSAQGDTSTSVVAIRNYRVIDNRE